MGMYLFKSTTYCHKVCIDRYLKNNIPLCVLDSWDSLDETKLNYKDFDFTYVDLSVCNLQILQSCVFTEI